MEDVSWLIQCNQLIDCLLLQITYEEAYKNIRAAQVAENAKDFEDWDEPDDELVHRQVAGAVACGRGKGDWWGIDHSGELAAPRPCC